MTAIAGIVFGGLTGVAMYVIGQLISKSLLEPAYELKKAIGAVRYNLAFHASTIRTPIGRNGKTSPPAKQALMDSSCNLIARLHAVPDFLLNRKFLSLPNRENIEKAAVQLRVLSTYVYEEGDRAASNIDVVNERVSKIEKWLCLKPLE